MMQLLRMDSDVAKILNRIDSESLKENTLMIFTGDNGMPFPGAKGNSMMLAFAFR